MSDDTNTEAAKADEAKQSSTLGGLPDKLARRELLPLPGLAAIGLYMMLLAGVSILGVVDGHFRPIYLVFSAIFITAALGLLLLLRWAWALALAAVVLLMGLFGWRFSTDHQLPFMVQGLLNLVFFLYLIRTEVRSKLR